MAQLYKMTLYVCDFEEDLSLEEIKTLIEDKALNGVAINCVCHFDDEKIGPHIEWDDDIDINYRNCTAEAWEAYFNE